jgi:hypothetical protein
MGNLVQQPIHSNSIGRASGGTCEQLGGFEGTLITKFWEFDMNVLDTCCFKYMVKSKAIEIYLHGLALSWAHLAYKVGSDTISPVNRSTYRVSQDVILLLNNRSMY